MSKLPIAAMADYLSLVALGLSKAANDNPLVDVSLEDAPRVALGYLEGDDRALLKMHAEDLGVQL